MFTEWETTASSLLLSLGSSTNKQPIKPKQIKRLPIKIDIIPLLNPTPSYQIPPLNSFFRIEER